MNEPDWRAIDRHLSGESTAEESTRVTAWLAGYPARRSLLRFLRGPSNPARSPVDVARAWDATLIRASRPMTPERAMPRVAWRAGGWAAAAAVILAAGWVVRAALISPRQAQQVAWREIAAPAGQPATVTMPDGSTMTLGPGSHAKYSADVGAGAREVKLEGDGLFDVRHDASRPFRVRAGGAVFEDLGTRFTIHTDRRGAFTVVTQGAVEVRRATAPESAALRVGAGMIGKVAADGRLSTASADTSRLLSWLDGRLVVDDARADDVASLLERWFGVDVVVRDSSLAAERVSLDIPNASLDATLEVISATLDVEVHREQQRIILARRRVPR